MPRMNKHQNAAIKKYIQWLNANAAALAAGEVEHEKEGFLRWVLSAETAEQTLLEAYIDYINKCLRGSVSLGDQYASYRQSREHYRQHILDVCQRRNIELDKKFTDSPYECTRKIIPTIDFSALSDDDSIPF